MIRARRIVFYLLPLVGLLAPLQAQAAQPDKATLRAWIQEMKASPKGPFWRIRWFCNDGTILPPRAYACRPHGGGVQHGEWHKRTKQLRASGYKIATVLAGLDVEAFTKQPDYRSTYKQIVLEQFLIALDDGWILRQARFYRGALQAEDEIRAARRLLLGLLHIPAWTTQGFLPLREGARLLSHGRGTATVTEVRQLSASLNKKDQGFRRLRNKIHAKPALADAAQVRQYAKRVNDPALVKAYQRLAAAIEEVFTPVPLAKTLQALAARIDHTPSAGALREGAAALSAAPGAAARFAITSRLLVTLRQQLPQVKSSSHRLDALDLSLALEREHFRSATLLRQQLAHASRRTRLSWLEESTAALYGSGLLSAREWGAMQDHFAALQGEAIVLGTYKAGLDYLARMPGWADQRLRLHFYQTMQHFAVLEPLANLFIQDRLRGSPLLWYADVLDSLLRDANRLAGVTHRLFGKEIGSGLRGLNPGLARGTLRLVPSEGMAFDANGIYLLPETTSELPPVAGILTAGAGNPLSHVQLLARNLGVPNVSIDTALLPQLAGMEDTPVVLAVSPAGSVLLAADRGQWQESFGQEPLAPETLIHPDLDKLDLARRQFIPTHQLRASDSGRSVGPKAAKLGELRHLYPKAVTDGLAIPFGFFRQLLDQPDQSLEGEGKDIFTWMVEQYAALRTLAEDSPARVEATETFRQRLQDLILHADPGEAFRQGLRRAMAQLFGADGTYGVFVRSDTNVEDLSGFTGAGLNLTVPNVVGFDQVLHALSRVWASPFSQRAYAWRQSHMDQPQHVYPSVLLLRSVPVEKSGVMVTQDIETSQSGWLSIAVNEGVGGAVDGQAAESLRVHMESGKVILLAQATAPLQYTLLPQGGVVKVPVSGADRVLEEAEIAQLIQLARELPQRFAGLKDAAGNPAPADIEFGFLKGELQLFQIRPFLESARARSSEFLLALDSNLVDQRTTMVSMHTIPTGEPL
ncbi:MAG: PEP/pyruvate-binding domain-containing protein [Candidatus Tectomicrobia bacterium]